MSDKALDWDQDALERINRAPFFVRKMAKAKVEKAARALGETRVTAELLDRIKREEMGE